LKKYTAMLIKSRLKWAIRKLTFQSRRMKISDLSMKVTQPPTSKTTDNASETTMTTLN